MSTKSSASKSAKVVALFPPHTSRESEKKWGKAVMKHGYCMLPSILLQAQSRHSVNAQEMMVLLQLAEHWWRAESKVFPAKEVIANRVGLSTRQVQRHIKHLEELKLEMRSALHCDDKLRTRVNHAFAAANPPRAEIRQRARIVFASGAHV